MRPAERFGSRQVQIAAALRAVDCSLRASVRRDVPPTDARQETVARAVGEAGPSTT
jgi:hypothetical protein